MDFPLVSIIVPVFNVEEYLERCLISIKNQTYSNIEVLIVNDGSTDNSKAIAEKYLTDTRFHLINKDNGGLASARNAGLKEVKGEYVCFIDGDDYVDKNYVTIMYNNLIENKADVSCCDYKRTNKNNDQGNYYKSIKVLTGNDILEYYLNNDITSACTKLYKLSVFNREEFPVNKLNEDIAINFRIFSRCSKIVIAESKLYMYYVRIGSITTSPFNLKKLDLIDAWQSIDSFYKNQKNDLIQKGIKYREGRAYFTLLGIIARYGFDVNVEHDIRNKIKRNLIKNFDKSFKLLFFSDKTAWNRKIVMLLFKLNFEICCMFGELYRKVV